jgi:two-component system, OmpR family, response regulator
MGGVAGGSRVTTPLSGEAAKPSTEHEMEIQTVLLVDDEPDIRLIAEMALGTVGGMTTLTAESGSEGIEVAAEKQPDLIMLDVMMPGMDGHETLERLREDERTKEIPVIFMTAKVQKSELDKLMALGAAAVVAKPFDPMTLADEVRRLAADL